MPGELQDKGAGIRTILFDYGGVLAEEGFREGLKLLAGRFGLDPEAVYQEGADAVYASGYVIGRADEKAFWELLCQRTGLPPYEPSFTTTILEGFVLRPTMMAAVACLRRMGYVTAILSDQTDWLDRLEARDRFFHHFDRVFNSFHLGKGKRDPSLFRGVVADLEIEPGEALFIDDHPGHVDRARSEGLQAFVFSTERDCLQTLERCLGLPCGA